MILINVTSYINKLRTILSREANKQTSTTIATRYFPPSNFVENMFSRKKSILHWLNFPNFLLKNPEFWSNKSILEKNYFFHPHSISNLCQAQISRFSFQLKKKTCSNRKHDLSYVFKKPNYSIRILRQTFYNLVMKIFQTFRFHNITKHELASKRKKNACVEWMIFFHT